MPTPALFGGADAPRLDWSAPLGNDAVGLGGWRMKVLDVLRKLGILRFGAETGTPGATDRPASLDFEEVFDSPEDRVTLAEVREVVASPKRR